MPRHILVLGGTSPAGIDFSLAALRDGHTLTLYVRNPSKLPPEIANNATLHKGELTDAAAIEKAVAYQHYDAAIRGAAEGDELDGVSGAAVGEGPAKGVKAGMVGEVGAKLERKGLAEWVLKEMEVGKWAGKVPAVSNA
ncbi:uncharacterized protein N0V89_008980 [Didymosphaeria variabile]|uniref:NAD(P)-binding domain-containing protein n=1 Tax=Didymosphaeria variabile TaxID=1932322 RepID=A0A9W9C938_9PLEO|nr:uncharacterized protein N0V89_008980 [Didymosphaeria variabile]KAJ4350359.1 hypothetical protein N0V89_008980 [Didymosphaeria variabile]